jgi:S-formylglutathione hydrolase FrmB
MFYLGEHLASHGYVVVGIDHTGSTNADIKETADRVAGFTDTLYNRARDQQFLLDYFTDQTSPVKAIVDTDRAAIIGHSMGGFGAINTVGGCYAFESEFFKQAGVPTPIAMVLPFALNSCYGGREQLDPRWKAVQLLAPWGGEASVHDIDAMAKITVPTFYLAGDQDNTSGFENGIKRLHERTGSEHNYLLVFENARHNIGPHPAPAASFATDFELGHYFDPVWDTETINRVVEHMSLAFLDCHVKADPAGCTYLPTRESSQQYKGADHQFDDAWKGFKHLWASGLQFYKK